MRSPIKKFFGWLSGAMHSTQAYAAERGEPDHEVGVQAAWVSDWIARSKEQERQMAEWEDRSRKRGEQEEALRQPYVISQEEFFGVVLPALSHIQALPDDPRATRLFYAFAGDDWRAASDAVDHLHMYCDARLVRDFVHGVCSAYEKAKRAQRDGAPIVRKLWPNRCPVCSQNEQPPEMSIAEHMKRGMAGNLDPDPRDVPAEEILAQFAAGRYELAHEILGDEYDTVFLCPGPYLMNRVEW